MWILFFFIIGLFWMHLHWISLWLETNRVVNYLRIVGQESKVLICTLGVTKNKTILTQSIIDSVLSGLTQSIWCRISFESIHLCIMSILNLSEHSLSALCLFVYRSHSSISHNICIARSQGQSVGASSNSNNLHCIHCNFSLLNNLINNIPLRIHLEEHRIVILNTNCQD